MKKILIVIDMQNDFIDMALGTSEAAACVPHVLRQILDPSYDRVFATMDTHDKEYLSTLEGKKLPVPHCIKGTIGWQLNPDVQKALQKRNAVILEKPGFGSMDLMKDIQKETPDSIVICGLCTDICVMCNAMLLRAALPGTPIAVDADACAAVTPAKQKEALSILTSCQIDIIQEDL